MGVWCKINVNLPVDGIHQAGNRVTGVIEYAVDKPTEYKDIVLSLVGQGSVRWPQQRKQLDGDGVFSRYACRGSEKYVSQCMSVLNENTRDNVILPIGHFKNFFQFILPLNIPSSRRWQQNSVECSIWYAIIAYFKTPNLLRFDKKFKKELTVRGIVTLPEPDIPVAYTLEKTLFTPFSNSENKVKLRCEVQKSLYTPGECITIKCLITNDSEKIINSIKSEIVSKTTYTAEGGYQNVCEEVIALCTCESPVIFENSIATLNLINPTLSKLCSIQQSAIVNRRFFVRVTVRLPFPHLNTCLEIPIVIGDTGYDEIASEATENPVLFTTVFCSRESPLPAYDDAVKLNNHKGET